METVKSFLKPPLAISLLLCLAVGLVSACQCRRDKTSTKPPDTETRQAEPSPAALEGKKSDLETELQSRFQELDRAALRMQQHAQDLDEAFRPKLNTALDRLENAKKKAEARLPQVKEVGEKAWQDFDRETHRALDELDILREEAEAYFKEKS